MKIKIKYIGHLMYAHAHNVRKHIIESLVTRYVHHIYEPKEKPHRYCRKQMAPIMNTEFDLQNEIAHIRSDIKSLAKLVRKLKNAHDDPTGEKAAARSANNGFNRPMGVSDKLRDFLGLAPGELISRSGATKRINAYINEKKAIPDSGVVKDGKYITSMDDALREILNPPEGFQVTALTINGLVSPHLFKVNADGTPEAPKEKPVKVPEPEPEVKTESSEEPKEVKKRPVVKKKTVVA
jgi:chromatin remodeling complex protein RSC6